MRVTSKGQVTIPREILEFLGIMPSTEVDFIEENGRVYLVKKTGAANRKQTFSKLLGVATVKMPTILEGTAKKTGTKAEMDTDEPVNHSANP